MNWNLAIYVSKSQFYFLHGVKSIHIRGFSGPYFPTFGLNMVRNTDTFHAVLFLGTRRKRTLVTITLCNLTLYDDKVVLIPNKILKHSAPHCILELFVYTQWKTTYCELHAFLPTRMKLYSSIGKSKLYHNIWETTSKCIIIYDIKMSGRIISICRNWYYLFQRLQL